MVRQLRTFFFYWFPLIVYIALIFFVSSLSRLPIDDRLSGHDKLLHFGEYALLATLMMRALSSLGFLSRLWSLILVCLICVTVLGAMDEWYQSIIPNRDSDIYDWLADILGGLTGMSAYILMQRMAVKKNQNKKSTDLR